MSDFAATWSLTRQRFVDSLQGLNHSQLNWRLHPDTLTIGEMALHVAGVEVSFATQLNGQTPEGELARLKAAATEGCVNDAPFPFSVEEITPEFVAQQLEIARSHAEPLVTNPTDELRSKQIKSALGPVIDGTGALVRLGFHPGYHHGQVHMIRTAPGFPK